MCMYICIYVHIYIYIYLYIYIYICIYLSLSLCATFGSAVPLWALLGFFWLRSASVLFDSPLGQNDRSMVGDGGDGGVYGVQPLNTFFLSCLLKDRLVDDRLVD